MHGIYFCRHTHMHTSTQTLTRTHTLIGRFTTIGRVLAVERAGKNTIAVASMRVNFNFLNPCHQEALVVV